MASSYKAMKYNNTKNTKVNNNEDNNYTYTKEGLKKSNPNLTYSDYDIALFNKAPGTYEKITAAKNGYLNATTDQEKKQWNDAAENTRLYEGFYTAGTNGMGYNPVYNPYNVDKVEYTAPQAYKSSYSNQIKELYNKLNNNEFEFDLASDPVYQSLYAASNRNGKKAMQNSLAEMSGQSGGFGVSSAAASAAQQQYNNYMATLNDSIPDIYAQAYDRYQAELNNDYNNLNILQALENTEYNRYRDSVSDSLNHYNIAENQRNQQINENLGWYNLINAMNSNQAQASQQDFENSLKMAELMGYDDYGNYTLEGYKGYNDVAISQDAQELARLIAEDDSSLNWYNAQNDALYKQGQLDNTAYANETARQKMLNDYAINSYNAETNRNKTNATTSSLPKASNNEERMMISYIKTLKTTTDLKELEQAMMNDDVDYSDKVYEALEKRLQEVYSPEGEISYRAKMITQNK